MIYRLLLAALCVVCFSMNAEARQRQKTYLAHPDCNGTGPNAMTCIGVAPSPRGERIAKSGFGSAQKVYTPKRTALPVPRPRPVSQASQTHQRVAGLTPAIVAHPTGCPSRAFCGCGAAVRIFGAPIRSLWLAANWFKFPRATPAAGMVAVRRHHVFVLEADLGGGVWRVYDANSGRHLTRIHARSIAGYQIVNPRAG